MLVATIIIVWIICGFVAACATYAHFQGAFPEAADSMRTKHTKLAVEYGLSGPVGLVLAASNSRGFRHGFLLPGTKPQPTVVDTFFDYLEQNEMDIALIDLQLLVLSLAFLACCLAEAANKEDEKKEV